MRNLIGIICLGAIASLAIVKLMDNEAAQKCSHPEFKNCYTLMTQEGQVVVGNCDPQMESWDVMFGENE